MAHKGSYGSHGGGGKGGLTPSGKRAFDKTTLESKDQKMTGQGGYQARSTFGPSGRKVVEGTRLKPDVPNRMPTEGEVEE